MTMGRCMKGGLLVAVLAGCTPAPVPDAVLPLAAGTLRDMDVLIITLDTTRRDHVGCYGEPGQTLVLERLCAGGLRLDQAIAVAPVTLPAHASLYTGLYPPRHGARYNGERFLGAEHTTLAEHLQAAGYQTAAFVSAFVLDHRFGLDQGFAVYDDTVAASTGPFTGGGNERDAASVTDAASAWLTQRDPDRPWFLWVHYFDPHTPYRPDPGDPDAAPEARYAREIQQMDAQIGRLLAHPALRTDRLLLMVLADHGESLGEHGERTHGLFIYDSTVHIPWLIAAPGLPPGTQHDALVSQVDLLPTVLELLGLDVPDGLDGRSLLQPPRAADASVYIETTLPYFDFRLAPLHALRQASAKYIHSVRPEFYDLRSDPREQHNLLSAAAPEPETAALLGDELDLRLQEWPAVNVPQQAAPADAAVRARLRSLGYLAGTDLGTTLTDPKDAVDLVNAHLLAAEAAAGGDVRAALAALDHALQAHPGARGALYLRARLRAMGGDTAGAEADIAQVNADRPNADSLLLQAQLWMLQQRPADARTLAEEAMRLDPSHGGAWLVLGDLHAAREDWKAAREAYQRALDLDAQRIGRQARSRLQRLP